MANPLTSAAFVKLLKADLREVAENKYKELPSRKSEFYRIVKSDSAWEEFYEIGALPDIQEFTGRLTYLGISPGYYTVIEPKEYFSGVMHERKLMSDKKYGVLNKTAASLMASAHRVESKLEVEPFNYAFSSAFKFQKSEEGVALCSDSHTTKAPDVSTSSGFDNAGTSILSKTSVAATRLLMRKFKNDIGERIDMGDNFALIVPDALADKATEIIGTPYGLDDATRNVNPQYRRHRIIPHLRLDDYDANNWFMVDEEKMKEDLIWIDREGPTYSDTIDFETMMAKQAVYMRKAYGFIGWRWIFGHNVS